VRTFVRFVLLGGGVGLASSAAVPPTATLMPWVVANALITVASTVLGTELHARFTFGTVGGPDGTNTCSPPVRQSYRPVRRRGQTRRQ
jgi:hypothetical protein